MSDLQIVDFQDSVSTMHQIERSFVFGMAGCRSIPPGFSEQGRVGGIRPPFACQLRSRWRRTDFESNIG